MRTVVKQPDNNKKKRFGPENGFKKGQSGNPGGRPPTIKAIPDILRRMGDLPPTEFQLAKLRATYGPDHNPKTMREAMLLSAYDDAMNGDAVARTFIAERTEGKVNDKIDFNDLTVTPENVGKVSTEQLLKAAMLLASVGKKKKDE